MFPILNVFRDSWKKTYHQKLSNNDVLLVAKFLDLLVQDQTSDSDPDTLEPVRWKRDT